MAACLVLNLLPQLTLLLKQRAGVNLGWKRSKSRLFCHGRPHGSSLEVMAVKVSHREDRLHSGQDVRLPGSPS